MKGLLCLFSRCRAVLLTALLAHPSAGATLQLLGDLPGGRVQSSASGLTADGSMLVGTTETLTDDQTDVTARAAYWTEATGWVPLPFTDPDYQRTRANAVNDDGSVIVGEGDNASFGRDEAAVWRRDEEGRYQPEFLTPTGESKFGFFATVNMTANAVSGDGSVVVGHGQTTDTESPFEAFYWIAESGVVPMGNLSNGPIPEAQFKPSYSSARAINRDGSVIVGMSWPGLRPNGSAASEAFRYETAANAMAGIGDLQSPVFQSTAEGISKDGRVIVGQARTPEGAQVAFRWTDSSGMVSLGDLQGSETVATARAANQDGSIIVGTGRTGRGQEAFIWTPARGIQRLADLAGLTETDLHGGWLESAVAVSDDGLTIAGTYRSDASNRPERQAYRLLLEGQDLAPAPDLAAIAAVLRLRMERLPENKLRLRFDRSNSTQVQYVLQQSDRLDDGFRDVISYTPDDTGGFLRTIEDDSFTADTDGSSPETAVETFPLSQPNAFWRILVRQ